MYALYVWLSRRLYISQISNSFNISIASPLFFSSVRSNVLILFPL